MPFNSQSGPESSVSLETAKVKWLVERHSCLHFPTFHCANSVIGLLREKLSVREYFPERHCAEVKPSSSKHFRSEKSDVLLEEWKSIQVVTRRRIRIRQGVLAPAVVECYYNMENPIFPGTAALLVTLEIIKYPNVQPLLNHSLFLLILRAC